MINRIASTEFDIEFDKIAHYQNYQLMRPYVGGNYHELKILLIAKNFYLPDTTKLNKTSESWYKGNPRMLSADERGWIDCRGLIECDWKSPGHFLFRELDRTLRKTIGGGFEKVAFMNAFMRPACKKGERFNFDKMDIEITLKTINRIQEILRPNKLIFVSKCAWDMLNAKIIEKQIAKKYSFVCGPGTKGRYWYNPRYSHGKSKFIELLKS